jgi:hypothetical protein
MNIARVLGTGAISAAATIGIASPPGPAARLPLLRPLFLPRPLPLGS